MIDDIARLSISIDSTSARIAATDLQNLGKAGDAAKSKIVSMGKGLAAAVGLAGTKNAIKEISTLAARYDTLGVVMNVAGRNAGYGNEQMALFEKQLRATGISALESRQSLASMATANMDLAESSKLARAAQDLAVVGNVNSSEALNRMIQGIQTGNTQILRSLGLNLQFEDSYDKLAKTLGKTASQLTENEKRQARMNAVLKETVGYTGIYEEGMTTAGKKLGSLTRHIEDFKVALGGAFQPALAAGVDAVTEQLKDMNTALERAKRNGDMERWGNQIKSAMDLTGGAVAGTTKLIWQNREAVMALAGAYGVLKAATAVAGVAGAIGNRWQNASTINHEAAVDAALKKNKAELALARKLNTQATINEAVASEKATLKKLHEAVASGKITISEYREAAAHYTNRMAMLEETRQQVLSGNAKKGMIGSIASFIGPMGLATIAIGAGAMAWSAYKRSIEEAKEAQDKMREGQLAQIETGKGLIASASEEAKAVLSSKIGTKERIEAQVKYNRTINDLIAINPEYVKGIKQQGEDYEAAADSAIKLAEAQLAVLRTQLTVANQKINDHNALIEKVQDQKGWKGLFNLAFGAATGIHNPLTWASNDALFAEGEAQDKHRDAIFAEIEQQRKALKDLKDIKERSKKARIDGDSGSTTSGNDPQQQFLDNLKREIDTMGMSRAEMIRYDAVKRQLTETNLKAAFAFADEVEALEKQAKATEYITGLQEQIEAFGKSNAELRKMAFDKIDFGFDLLSAQYRFDELEKLLAAKEKEKNLEEAMRALAGLDIKDNVLKKELLNEQIKALNEQIDLVAIKHGWSAETTEEFRKQAVAITDGTKALADSFISRHESPDAMLARKTKGLNELLYGKDPTTGMSFIGIDTYTKALADLRNEHLRLKAAVLDARVDFYERLEAARTATLEKMMSDDTISPGEKRIIKAEVDRILSMQASLVEQAGNFGVSASSLNSVVDSLLRFLANAETGIGEHWDGATKDWRDYGVTSYLQPGQGATLWYWITRCWAAIAELQRVIIEKADRNSRTYIESIRDILLEKQKMTPKHELTLPDLSLTAIRAEYPIGIFVLLGRDYVKNGITYKRGLYVNNNWTWQLSPLDGTSIVAHSITGGEIQAATLNASHLMADLVFVNQNLESSNYRAPQEIIPNIQYTPPEGWRISAIPYLTRLLDGTPKNVQAEFGENVSIGGRLVSTLLTATEANEAARTNVQTNGDKGLAKLPGGFILQWVVTPNIASVTNIHQVSFIEPFPQDCFCVAVTTQINSGSSTIQDGFYLISKNLASCRIWRRSAGASDIEVRAHIMAFGR